MKKIHVLYIIVFMGSFFFTNLSVSCQETDQLIIVPAIPSNPAFPYVVPGQTPITLKAILRNTTSTSGYSISWDTNNDGIFSPSETFYREDDPEVNGIRDFL